MPKVEDTNCSQNNIIKIEALPECKYIVINANKLEQLPPLKACIYLMANDNYLTSLPEVAAGATVECSYNMIIDLPKQFINFDGSIKANIYYNGSKTLVI
jgi:Leucine-rich repeat (LRR) protein